MSEAGEDAPDAFEDALIAARLCAIDPGLGGMILRGGGERRDAIIEELRAGLPEASWRRLPVHIDDERLLGGIDLTATLASGKPVSRAGLLAEVAGGILVVPMAERLPGGTAAHVAAALDKSRFVIVALDDGLDVEEQPPAALIERLAFRIDLNGEGGLSRGVEGSLQHPAPPIDAAFSENHLAAIVATANALGVDSARASLFAMRAARASARLAGRESVADEDVTLAVRLVLASRATRIPMEAEDAASEPPPPAPETGDGEEEQAEPGPLNDIVLAATLATLPKDVLARIAAGGSRRAAIVRASGGGERRKSSARGRPMGARAGTPGGGRRLSLIDTLRAAAPWQRLRGIAESPDHTRVRIRRDDLRIRRFETRAEALTIFAVDASGSSALARLAEAKGAVELLLAEAYVKRAQVALVAFRGTAAELLLPPTRSLARARRSLAALPGGGGTPLAAGLNAARELAEAGAARGRTPFIVVLTDGRANVAADGGMVRAAAEADAAAAARAIGAAGIAAAFVDISARPRAEGAALAAAMRARYLPLPRADAAAMHAAIGAARRG